MTTKETQGSGGMAHEHSELWNEINKLKDRHAAMDVNAAKLGATIDGKLDLLVDRHARLSEQCDRLETATTATNNHLRELNGRTKKAEDAISALQTGAAIASRGHVRADDHQPRKVLSTYSRKQQTAVLGGGVLIVLGAFDLLKEIGTIVMALMKRGAP